MFCYTLVLTWHVFLCGFVFQTTDLKHVLAWVTRQSNLVKDKSNSGFEHMHTSACSGLLRKYYLTTKNPLCHLRTIPSYVTWGLFLVMSPEDYSYVLVEFLTSRSGCSCSCWEIVKFPSEQTKKLDFLNNTKKVTYFTWETKVFVSIRSPVFPSLVGTGGRLRIMTS